MIQGMTQLRVLVIGQSPRPDLAAEIAAAAPGLRFAIEGALDGLPRAELDALAPRDGADTLFTVLPSGEAVTVSKAAVTARLGARIGAGPILLACTGAFAGLPERPDLVRPSSVLNALADALLPRGRLGLFVPLPEQLPSLAEARRRAGLEVVAVPLRPQSNDAARDAAGREMASLAPDLALLDCISYTRADRARVGALLRCPVLLSVAVAARVAASLLSEG
jgi:protein AroM